ncbi:aquaporin [Blastococcus sp. CT_GayMR20]|uniref:MIP/aquaporin family protein n=1 Tax=Blastococcus sp. CT_GayMR20 TaxID=2559609 RepID=UPI0010746EB3|nr:aquaporin [Blastococcus sp. CT_GayMR20]TFV82933.1 aquaporin [Blastococcus sp. CT_GayMR20]TFV82938.1 aquaporin [Blastococcus sp. CT_GayMR20]
MDAVGVARGSTSAGLYGSTVSRRPVRAAVAEFLGTAVLVYVGTSVAVASAARGEAVYDTLAVVLAFGLVLVALVAAFGHVSGCHLNPAITVGLAVTRRFPWSAAGVYVLAQLGGGLLGALCTWVSYGGRARSEAGLAATRPADGVSVGQAFLVELLVTFVLVLVVISVATDDRAESSVAPVAVGFALAAAIFVAGPLTGGAVNPARAFGPNLLAGDLAPLWLYLVAPTLGGILAAVLYDRVLAAGEPPEAP